MSERWKPENGETYYYVNHTAQVDPLKWVSDGLDTRLYAIGNCFKTEEEAKAAVEKIKVLLLSLHEPVTECNQLPKLIAEVFNYPGCPEWAKYAAVDGNGCAYYYSERPSILFDEFRWESARGEDIRWKLVPGKFNHINWSESLIDRPAKLPKLTAEIFDRPDFPKIAEYVVVTKDGGVIAYTHKPYINEEIPCWGFNRGCNFTVETAGAYDSSDWQNSLIERPVKLPEWCKVGEWIYDKYFHDYIKVVECTHGAFKGKHIHGEDHYADFNFEAIAPARFRPYEAEEMYELIGKYIEDAEEVMLVTGFYKKDNLVKAGDEYYDAERLFNECTINGNPCGKLKHLNEEGEWVE